MGQHLDNGNNGRKADRGDFISHAKGVDPKQTIRPSPVKKRFTRRSLTQAAYSSIELESRGTVERWTISRHPLSSVRGQFTHLKASIVEKPAARQIIGLRAQSTAH